LGFGIFAGNGKKKTWSVWTFQYQSPREMLRDSLEAMAIARKTLFQFDSTTATANTLSGKKKTP
jgi:hypothetical protein